SQEDLAEVMALRELEQEEPEVPDRHLVPGRPRRVHERLATHDLEDLAFGKKRGFVVGPASRCRIEHGHREPRASILHPRRAPPRFVACPKECLRGPRSYFGSAFRHSSIAALRAPSEAFGSSRTVRPASALSASNAHVRPTIESPSARRATASKASGDGARRRRAQATSRATPAPLRPSDASRAAPPPPPAPPA